MATITQTVGAWISNHSFIGPEDFEKQNFSVASLAYCRPGSDKFWMEQGYTYIGDATITIETPDRKTLIDNKVSALREELKTVRAEAHKKSIELEDKIANLLAITYEPNDGAA